MLQHEMNVVFRLIDLNELDYVFMIQLSKKTDFLSTFFSIVLIANFSELF